MFLNIKQHNLNILKPFIYSLVTANDMYDGN